MANFTHSELKDWVADNYVLETKKENGQEVEVKLTKKQADDLLKLIFGKVTAEVTKGNDVKMLGIGTAKRNKREAKMGRNPITKETLPIPAHYALKLDAEKSVKDSLKALPIEAE
ncbi:MAG: Bacterial DNA-binding protein [Herbinix sp.]|jgi:nucleoid DNA-binding protein|nr:Bacterial DNA-binding protein [Herbinix sp.]